MRIVELFMISMHTQGRRDRISAKHNERKVTKGNMKCIEKQILNLFWWYRDGSVDFVPSSRENGMNFGNSVQSIQRIVINWNITLKTVWVYLKVIAVNIPCW